MAIFDDLCHALAQALSTEHAWVRGLADKLVNAGKVTPDPMDETDAAMLLIATLSTEGDDDLVTTLDTFASLPSVTPGSELTLRDALEDIISQRPRSAQLVLGKIGDLPCRLPRSSPSRSPASGLLRRA